MSRKPKKKCCVSTPRCSRCPLRMLADGTLPAGLTVRHRRLVKVGSAAHLTTDRKKKGKKGKKHKGRKRGKKAA